MNYLQNRREAAMNRRLFGRRRQDPMSSRDRITEILKRYPGISDEEGSEIVRFLKQGSLLEIGLLTGDDTIKANLDRFMKGHAKRLALTWQNYVVIGLIVIALIVTLALFWDSAVN